MTRKRRLSKFKTNLSGDLARFEEPTLGLIPGANFSESDDDSLISKKALIIVEGKHTDNSGKGHVFTPDDIEWFANSTNDFIDSGGRIPWQEDHNKSQKHNIGDLESYIETRVITAEDLPDPKLRTLVGKVGAFATNLVGKGKDVVEQIKAGRIKTLSPGIDMATGIIREISATPTPAIVGMSVFSRSSAKGSNATTWEEAESVKEIDDSLRGRIRADYRCALEHLFKHPQASEEEVPLNNREGMFDDALEGFAKRFTELLGVTDKNTDYPVCGDKPGLNRVGQGEQPAQAQNRTEKLSLSSNLEAIAEFRKPIVSKGYWLKGGVGPVGGFIGGFGNREGVGVAAGVHRRKRRRKKRKRSK